MTGSISNDLLSRAPAPGEWSALECQQHLLDTERYVFPVRVQLFLTGRDLAAFNPDEEGTSYQQSPAELAAEFASLRADSLKTLANVSQADLALIARHSELGVVTLGEMLNEWAAHDLMHTVQAERALMQPFITGSGAWRVYFQDHDVDVKNRPGT
jgi:hypothetical protein